MNNTTNAEIEQYRQQNRNYNFTLISRDCIGGIVYNQLGLPFLSPTVNLFFSPADFNLFCLHLKDYLDAELIECYGFDYLAGVLLTPNHPCIIIHFMHYKNFLEAKECWERRKERINWNNIYIVSSFCYPGETEHFNEQLIVDWNNIPYKKVIFVNQSYGFENEYVIQQPLDCTDYAWLLSFINSNSWRRVINKYDWISFLNS